MSKINATTVEPMTPELPLRHLEVFTPEERIQLWSNLRKLGEILMPTQTLTPESPGPTNGRIVWFDYEWPTGPMERVSDLRWRLHECASSKPLDLMDLTRMLGCLVQVVSSEWIMEDFGLVAQSEWEAGKDEVKERRRLKLAFKDIETLLACLVSDNDRLFRGIEDGSDQDQRHEVKEETWGDVLEASFGGPKPSSSEYQCEALGEWPSTKGDLDPRHPLPSERIVSVIESLKPSTVSWCCSALWMISDILREEYKL